MECNRDEALRAKEIAERKFIAKDFKKAKKFALKAHNLYPELEGISHLLTTLDIYISAEEEKIRGESNWYGVLGVTRLADEETIKKQYKKLALVLHPDKNKSIGAEGAFQLVSQAWGMLSDKSRRIAYDQRYGATFQQRNQTMNSSHVSKSQQKNHKMDTGHAATFQQRNQKIDPDHGAKYQQGDQKMDTGDGATYQQGNQKIDTGDGVTYQQGNQKMDTGHGVKDRQGNQKMDTGHGKTFQQRNRKMNTGHGAKYQQGNQKMDTVHGAISQQKNLKKDTGHGATFQQRDQTTSAGPSQPPPPKQNGSCNFEKTGDPQVKIKKGNSSKKDSSSVHKRERQTFWTFCHRCKMQYEYLRMYRNQNLLCPNCQEAYFAMEIEPPSTNDSKKSHRMSDLKNGTQQGSSGARRTSGFSRGNESNPSNFQWTPFSESAGTASAAQAANMVQQAYEKVKLERQKAQAALRKKNLATKRMAGPESSCNPGAAKRRKGIEDFGSCKETMKHDCKPNNVGHMDIKQVLMEKARKEISKKLNESLLVTNAKNASGKEVCENITENVKLNLNDKVKMDQMVVNVPDPDFYNFDKDRMEKCFGENQVWAVYDNDDGMPRHYTMIQNVISLNPFKVRMSWLKNSITDTRLGHGSLFRGGFSKACGEFRIGRSEVFNSLDSFSHLVIRIECKSDTIQVQPQKGNIWALYRNWSPDWNELTEDQEIYKYDMVEVLEDYNEKLGVIVVPLVKVAGFKAVFHHHFNPKEIRRIPKDEMCRFSHQVPSHMLSKSCRELDPAAISSEILESALKTEEIEFIQIDKDIKFVKSVDVIEVE